jgi:hypothetical protein
LAERIEIALSNLGDGIEDLTPFAEGHRFRTEIRLPDFGSWAESIWPDLPQDFPRSTPTRTQAVAAENIREADGVTVRLPHLPRALSALFDIMRKHYDPKKPPKQTSVAAEIDKAMGWKAQKDGKPSRNADVLAAIIRPDSEADADPRASGRRRRS